MSMIPGKARQVGAGVPEFCATLASARCTAMPSTPPPRYSGVAIALHWLLAAALAASFCVGVFMSDLATSPLKLRLINWHKWAGITILAFSSVRLVWRLTHAPPPDVAMPAWQRSLAHFSHRTMYGLFFAVPLAGWAYTSAAGFPVVLFGALPLPDFVPADKALAERIEPWHAALAFALAGMVLVHVAAAIKHHFVDRDGLLRRMWWHQR
jgi:cytochrome b561